MKNLKNLKSGFIAALVAASVAGCVSEDDLVQVNPNMETEGSFWQSEADAIRGVNAVYGSLYPDGAYMRCTPIMLDGKGDESRSNSPWVAMAQVGRFSSQASNPEIYGWAYETFYQGVFRANQALKNIPNISMENEALKNRLLGQAHFMRGLYFFHLVNMFKSVPLPLEAGILYNPQKTQEEGWAQVYADMEAAAALLPVSYMDVNGADAGEKGRATKGAALAYLAKAKLFNHDYAAAKSLFEQVMELGIYSLVSNYRDNFTTANENNSESVFEIQFSRDAGGVDLGWGGAPASGWGKTTARAITYAPRGFGWTDMQPTWSLFNDFQLELTVDGQKDPRLNATIFYNGGDNLYGHVFSEYYAGNPANLNDIYIAKYQNSSGSQPDEFDWRSGINERLLRYADVLMMYAECLNELGQTAQAYPFIQQVRDRVNLPDLATVRPNMTQQQMRDQIAHERLLEFAFEGHRFDDIRRWGWLDDPAKLAWLTSRDAEFATYVEGHEYFPIPQLDMDNNPGMSQNFGY